jgi:hypothetical protein
LSAARVCITATQTFCLQPASASQQLTHFVCSSRVNCKICGLFHFLESIFLIGAFQND